MHSPQNVNTTSEIVNESTSNKNYNISLINSSAYNYEFSKSNSSFIVGSGDYYNYSGVLINFTTNFLSFNFSWNFKFSYSMTEIYFLLHYGNSEFKVEFGVETNNLLYATNPKRELIFLPMNHEIHISFLIEHNTSYFWLSKSNSNYYFHVTALNTTKVSNNFIKIFGKYYFLNISNISTFFKNKFCGIIHTSSNTQIHNTLLDANKFYFGTTTGPLFDNKSDTFLFVSKNSSLYSYNEFTGNLRKFYTLYNSTLLDEYSGDWHLYFYFNSNHNQTLLLINKTNFYVKKIVFKESNSFFVFTKGKPMIFNKSSYFLATDIGKITEINSSLVPANYSLKSIFVNNSEIYYLFQCNSTLFLYELLDNKLNSVFCIHNCSLFYTYNYETHSILPEIYIENISLYKVLVSNEYSMEYLTSFGNNLSLFSNANSTVLSTGQNKSIIHGVVQYITGGNGIILIIMNGTIFTYGHCFPLSNLSINCSKFYVLVKSGNMNTSVISYSNYSENIMIGNYTQTQNNTSNFKLNLTLLKSGIYNYTVKVIDIQGYEQFFRGKIEVDNSVPIISILTNTTQGVFNYETLKFVIQDPIGISNEEIVMGKSVFFYNSNNVNITVPYNKDANTLNITFHIQDDWGNCFNRTFKFEYYVETVNNLSINLYNNEIVNRNDILLNISSISENISTFQISVLDNKTDFMIIYNSTENFYFDLNNGSYLISLYCKFITGNYEFLRSFNITVIAYLPTIMVSGLNKRYYSFFTNSQNNSLNLFANSSISGHWVVDLYGPNGLCNVFTKFGNTFHLVINKNNINSNLSGKFNLNFTLNTINHYNVSFQKSFIVNETILFPSTSKILYINVSHFSIYEKLSFLFSKGVRSYVMDNNSTEILNENFSFNNSGFFIYNIISYNDANSFSESNITFIVSFIPPVISIEGENKTVFSNIVKLQYSSISSIPIKRISIINSHKFNYSVNNTTILFDILKDGNYSVLIKFENYCGNSIIEYYNFSEQYYVFIQNVKLTYSLFFNTFSAKIKLFGYSVNKSKISWWCNGKNVSAGNNIRIIVPNGIDHINLMVEWSNRTTYYNLTVFSLSSAILESGTMVIIFFILLFKLPLRYNTENLCSFILKNQNKKIKHIRKRAMKMRYGKLRFMNALKILKANGKIEFKSDLNGDQWLILTKE